MFLRPFHPALSLIMLAATILPGQNVVPLTCRINLTKLQLVVNPLPLPVVEEKVVPLVVVVKAKGKGDGG